MRISQIIFEAWLKPICAAEPLIDDRWGWTFKTLVEKDDHVLSTVVDEWGKEVTIKSKFVVGCDGAGSPVRTAAGLEAKRKPLCVLPLGHSIAGLTNSISGL
jgi:2-polyprenyl-6-methoxyphenol hydroxylase-like FAD-dependent oxidoreductase